MREDRCRKQSHASFCLERIAAELLSLCPTDLQREVLTRRFGLSGSKESLDRIGRDLACSKQNVWQVEQTALAHLGRLVAEHRLPAELNRAYDVLVARLRALGGVARAGDLANRRGAGPAAREAEIMFAAGLCPRVVVLPESKQYYNSISMYDRAVTIQAIHTVTRGVREHGEPVTPAGLANVVGLNLRHTEAMARVSKQLTLCDDGRWGLASEQEKIQTRIEAALRTQGEPMYFADVAAAVQAALTALPSQKQVSTRAVLNELIRNDTFVLAGPGYYALREWGYEGGVLRELVADVLRMTDHPLTKEEIIAAVRQRRPAAKESSIAVALRRSSAFLRHQDGTYAITRHPSGSEERHDRTL